VKSPPNENASLPNEGNILIGRIGCDVEQTCY